MKEKLEELARRLEGLTNPEGLCPECKHTAPDHWKACGRAAMYWEAIALAEELRKLAAELP